MTDSYAEFFERATGSFEPYPYQRRLAEMPWSEWPEVLDIPTGLGKTAAVVLGWLWRRHEEPDETPRRLVYTLPMRSLVTQTVQEARGWIANLEGDPSDVFMLMGGERQTDWAEAPEQEAIIVGTQDMLISRALMRGYGMSRYKWPVHFSLLHNDAFWVFDETQLMGPTVETSAQLQAFRDELGTAKPTRSMWMSATVADAQIDTVDHPRPEDGWQRLDLSEADRESEAVGQRLNAQKNVVQSAATVPNSTGKNRLEDYGETVAGEVLNAHSSGELTLVVANTVGRARAIYEQLKSAIDEAGPDLTLIHSRFRQHERARREEALERDDDRIVVSTQVVEAGVDLSARTLFTELAPWSSIVQRIGRCNRYGEFNADGGAQVFWIDAEDGDKAAGPYDRERLSAAREHLETLDNASPTQLGLVDHAPQVDVHPILRRKDLIELFDTTPDLSGRDIDVSPYIRDADDTDAFVYWRRWDGEEPPEAESDPDEREICRVSVWGQNGLDGFLGKSGVKGWRWRPLEGEWEAIDRKGVVRPGQTVLLAVDQGGYSEETGWTGNRRHEPTPVPGKSTEADSMDGERESNIGAWLSLKDHLADVHEAAGKLADDLELDKTESNVVKEAARWHDVGKVHPQFQNRLLQPARDDEDLDFPSGQGPWAKSNHQRGRYERRHFRHELASAMAYLDWVEGSVGDARRDLVAYLIAAHHGKVRLSIRSLPGEMEPDTQGRLFARGVWDGDSLDAVSVPEEGQCGPFELDLSPMQLGAGSWIERTIALRDASEMGPFRLSWLESLIRIADWRASEDERHARTPETSAQRASTDSAVVGAE